MKKPRPRWEPGRRGANYAAGHCTSPSGGPQSEPSPAPSSQPGGKSDDGAAGGGGGNRETLTPGPASRLGLPFCPPRPGPSAVLAAFEVPIQSGATSIYTTGQKSV